MFRRPLAPLAIVMFLAVPATAWAVPKVALTAIDGDSESEVRDAVADALDGDELKLVGKKETNRAADKLGDLSELNEKNAKKLAKDLSADAIVIGSLDKDGAQRVLKFKLYVNGKARKGFSIKFKNASSPKFKEALKKKMVEKLDGAGTGAGAGDEEVSKKPKKPAKGEDEEEPIAKAPKKPEKGEKAAKAPKKPEKGDKPEKAEGGEEEEGAKAKPAEGGEEEEGAKAKPAEGDEEEAPKKGGKKAVAALGDEEEIGVSKRGVIREKGRAANHAAIRFGAGLSAVQRQLLFNTNLPSNKAPQPFKPSVVPGARIEGELYPIAFASPTGIASGLGVAFEYDRTLTMNVGTSAEPGVKIPVEQFHYSFGPRFRIVGKSAGSPAVTLGADIGRNRFRPNRSGLMEPSSLDLPDTYYKFIAPGLGLRIPLGGVVAFTAGGSVLVISDAGQIVRSYSYGQAKVFGIEAQGGLELVFGKRFLLRAIGEFTQIGYQFQGNGGVQANSRDGDPTTRDVGGAADRYFGGALTFGVSY